MPAVKALELADHLAQGDLKPVYALVGDDAPLMSESVSLLRQAVDRPEFPGSSIRDLEDPPAPSAVFDELRTLPFMGTPGVRLVIVRAGDQFMADHGEAILTYLEKPSPTGVLVLCHRPPDDRKGRQAETDAAPKEQADKEKKAAKLAKELTKVIGRIGMVVDCARATWASAKDWLREKARAEGKTFTPAAADALVEAAGADPVALRGELEKLIAFVGDERTVTERDVEDVVPQSRSRSIFELSDAIARSDAARALALGERLLLRGEGPEEIIAFLARQTRRLAQVKMMLDGGATEKQIAREMFKGRDFAARKEVAAARRLTDEWFARQTAVLAEADVYAKTTSVQAKEQGVWISALLARLCQ